VVSSGRGDRGALAARTHAARVLSDGALDAIVEGFRVSAAFAVAAGFQVIEFHAAHGYLLAQFLSAPGPLDGRLALLERIVREIRACGSKVVVGIRLSGDDTPDALPRAGALADYVNVTVGQRTTYVRDMATEVPPSLAGVARLRELVDAPLLVSQAFRTPAAIEAALAAGADLVGMARADRRPGRAAQAARRRAAEVLPDIPGIGRALRASDMSELGGRDVLVVDDGFGR